MIRFENLCIWRTSSWVSTISSFLTKKNNFFLLVFQVHQNKKTVQHYNDLNKLTRGNEKNNYNSKLILEKKKCHLKLFSQLVLCFGASVLAFSQIITKITKWKCISLQLWFILSSLSLDYTFIAHIYKKHWKQLFINNNLPFVILIIR